MPLGKLNIALDSDPFTEKVNTECQGAYGRMGGDVQQLGAALSLPAAPSSALPGQMSTPGSQSQYQNHDERASRTSVPVPACWPKPPKMFGQPWGPLGSAAGAGMKRQFEETRETSTPMLIPLPDITARQMLTSLLKKAEQPSGREMQQEKASKPLAMKNLNEQAAEPVV